MLSKHLRNRFVEEVSGVFDDPNCITDMWDTEKGLLRPASRGVGSPLCYYVFSLVTIAISEASTTGEAWELLLDTLNEGLQEFQGFVQEFNGRFGA